MSEHPKTWADIERAAMTCPVLHAAATMERQGLSREQALIGAALFLSDLRQRMMQAEVDRLMNDPRPRR